jgi:hypothetical protein
VEPGVEAIERTFIDNVRVHCSWPCLALVAGLVILAGAALVVLLRKGRGSGRGGENAET